MRTFFSQNTGPNIPIHQDLSDRPHSVLPPATSLCARIAIYDSEVAAPRIEDIRAEDPATLIATLSTRVYSAARACGGAIPYTVVREIVENLFHAEFKEIVVSVLDDGNTLRFADQGPGILDKDQAQLPGFTTATQPMKIFIRGVGSGLPIVREFLSHQGGKLAIDDNLGTGTVVSLYGSLHEASSSQPELKRVLHLTPAASEMPVPRLSTRQKKVLSLVLEFGGAGPTLVSKELSVGLSTAYRDLAYLESSGLIRSDETGKRELTELGSECLGKMFS